ncbi:MAG: hypothetical protein ABIP75_20370, partial [Pyrinomonadaceae bacterium]
SAKTLKSVVTSNIHSFFHENIGLTELPTAKIIYYSVRRPEGQVGLRNRRNVVGKGKKKLATEVTEDTERDFRNLVIESLLRRSIVTG